jgi:hypothetical protein
MKIRLLTAGLFFLGGVISTHAQTGGVRVKVPFEFEIANKHLPAGEYVVSSDHEQVWLRVYRGNTVAVVQSNHAVHDGGKTGKVVFNCYEKLCFLSKLWLPDADGAREILASNSEKQAARREKPQQLALLAKPMRSADTN